MKNLDITTIKAKKDLYNHGRCFTKGREYTINKKIYTAAGCMDEYTINDQGERHLIGSWWREFELID
jgi:hypothetical protein